MDGGFLEKLKALLMGSQGPTAPSQTTNEGKPWEDPSLSPPPRPAPSPSPTPGPEELDPIGAQVRQLVKQREIEKRLIPESSWNR
jgi:hypothetical protein